MRVSDFKRRSNIAEWKRAIESFQCSGLSLREWCVKHGMTEQQYYYRFRRVREFILDEVENKSSTVSLVKYSLSDDEVPEKASKSNRPSDSRIIVRYGELKVSFPGTTDLISIARFMKELAQ